MAKKEQPTSGNQVKLGRKHPLLVYRFLARRYRPAGVTLFLFGLLAQLPWFIPELRFKTAILTYDKLAFFGLLMMVIGATLWIISIFRGRRAYVQCLPQYLVISTAEGKIYVAYQRFNSMKPVLVKDIFKLKEVPGRQRPIIKPLLSETALEADVSEYPLPEREMHRRLSRFLFSTREKGFIFLVPNHTQLSTEIDAFLQRARETRRSEEQRYLDPIERLRYQRP